MVLTQGGSVLYVCTKCDADSSVRSELITVVPKFRHHACDTGHALKGSFFSIHGQGPSSVCVPYWLRGSLI